MNSENYQPSWRAPRTNWKRPDATAKVFEFEREKHIRSQRDFTKGCGIPRSTLRHWIARKNRIDESPIVINFFESPEGLAVLHRIVTVAHKEFTKKGTASIHNVSNFLKETGLSLFIASSYSTQCRVSKQMDELIVLFGDNEKSKLAKGMPEKKIGLLEDETFHPKTCLVAIEPVSNFIIMEKYAENRESATWNDAVKSALKDLPVEIIQVTGDEGRSLVCHAEKGLGVHHSSDCFHVIQEIGKGTSGALASKIKKAEKEYETAVKRTSKADDLKEKFDNAIKRPRGRRPNFEKKIQEAKEQEKMAEDSLNTTRENQESVRSSKAEIGQVYHPYNLNSGEQQDARKVSALLEECFDNIKTGARELSDRCQDRVNKAHRVVKKMVATIS
ncbi:MAG: hypothetical protein GY841_05230, partial [FCB group bacterium]|nr:hypothetical protein [FCB group bacterium]